MQRGGQLLWLAPCGVFCAAASRGACAQGAAAALSAPRARACPCTCRRARRAAPVAAEKALKYNTLPISIHDSRKNGPALLLAGHAQPCAQREGAPRRQASLVRLLQRRGEACADLGGSDHALHAHRVGAAGEDDSNREREVFGNGRVREGHVKGPAGYRRAHGARSTRPSHALQSQGWGSMGMQLAQSTRAWRAQRRDSGNNSVRRRAPQ